MKAPDLFADLYPADSEPAYGLERRPRASSCVVGCGHKTHFIDTWFNAPVCGVACHTRLWDAYMTTNEYLLEGSERVE